VRSDPRTDVCGRACPCRANPLGAPYPGGPPAFRVAVYGIDDRDARGPPAAAAKPAPPRTVTYSLTGRPHPARWAHDGAARGQRAAAAGAVCAGGGRRSSGKASSLRAEVAEALEWREEEEALAAVAMEGGEAYDSDAEERAAAGATWAWEGAPRLRRGPATGLGAGEREVEAAVAASLREAAEWEEAQLAVALSLSMADADAAVSTAAAAPAAVSAESTTQPTPVAQPVMPMLMEMAAGDAAASVERAAAAAMDYVEGCAPDAAAGDGPAADRDAPGGARCGPTRAEPALSAGKARKRGGGRRGGRGWARAEVAEGLAAWRAGEEPWADSGAGRHKHARTGGAAGEREVEAAVAASLREAAEWEEAQLAVALSMSMAPADAARPAAAAELAAAAALVEGAMSNADKSTARPMQTAQPVLPMPAGDAAAAAAAAAAEAPIDPEGHVEPLLAAAAGNAAAFVATTTTEIPGAATAPAAALEDGRGDGGCGCGYCGGGASDGGEGEDGWEVASRGRAPSTAGSWADVAADGDSDWGSDGDGEWEEL
jgi:hypothetical protein